MGERGVRRKNVGMLPVNNQVQECAVKIVLLLKTLLKVCSSNYLGGN